MCVLCCLTLSPGGATYRRTVYHGTAAICISIELYEIVQLRSGDCVVFAVDVVVNVVGPRLRGSLLIRSVFIKKRQHTFFILANKFVKRTVR